MSDIIGNLLVNNARKSMLESIDGIDDINFLKKELKEHLKNEFDLKQRIDKAIEYIKDYKYQWCRNDEVISDMNELLSILKGENK